MRVCHATAMAAGRDAGNASMRAGGRAAWNAQDYDAAARLARRLLAFDPPAPPSAPPRGRGGEG